MKVFFVSGFDLRGRSPGLARKLALAKGLRDSGAAVTLGFVRESKGCCEIRGYEQISVVGLCDQSSLSSPILWRISSLRSLANMLSECHLEENFLLVMSRDPFVLLGSVWIARRRGLRVFYELTEFPDIVSAGPVRQLFSGLLAGRVAFRVVDGVVAISPQLASWVRARSAVPIVVLPGIVDLDLFHPTLTSPSDEWFEFGYCGSLSETKDGVLSLLKAFAMARNVCSPSRIKLRIIAGEHSGEEMEALRGLIDLLDLANDVVVLGPVPRSEVARHLAACSALVMARPASRQAEGGFPTKLGEYLASGRAVIATRVGSIPNEVESERDVLLVEPGRIDLMSQAMVTLARDRGLATRLGTAARARAEAAWSPASRAAALSRFVREVR